MKACTLEAIGKIEYKEVPMPRIKEDEVLVKIKACGICSSDIQRIFQMGTYRFPTIPGHEISGVVIEVGKDVNEHWLHQNVVIFPLLPCFHCNSCRKEQYSRCENYSYFGSRCDGGFAEYLAVPVWNLISFSSKIDYKLAALCEPAAVALHAVQRGKVTSQDHVIIVGTGIIAFLTGIWCKEQGVNKISILCRNQKKGELAAKMGFHIISEPGEKEGMISGNKVFECVGSEQALGQAIELTKRGGTLTLIGNPEGSMTLNRNIYWKLLRNEITVVGSWNSEYGKNNNNWKQVIKKMEEGTIPFAELITDSYPLEEYDIALSRMLNKKTRGVKTVLEI